VILLDRREPDAIKSALLHACERSDIPVSVTEEKYGDFILMPPTGTQKIVAVERKAVSDFVSSLTSGRLQTQLDGLRGACDIPYLLVEGDLHSTVVDGKHMLLLGGRASKFNLWSLQMYIAAVQDSGVRWAHTNSVAHTVLWVVKNYQRMCKGGTEVTVFARPKEKTLRPDIAALCAAPGVGPKVAKALVDKFGTIHATISANDDALLALPGFGPSALKALRYTFGQPRAS
jgi:ERCC4-type nuclease